MEEKGTHIFENSVSGVLTAGQGTVETAPQLYFLFGFMILLLCYTIHTVGDRGTGITGALFCIVAVTAIVLNLSNLALIFEIFQVITFKLHILIMKFKKGI